MKRRDAFWAAFRTELRLIRAETAPKLVIALTVGALLYALVSGLTFSTSRQQSAVALQLSAAEKFAAQREQAQQIAEGKQAIPDRPYRDPGNTIFVGASTAAIAELPQSPLSFLAVGESDLYPAAIPVSAKGKENFLFDDEISNPTHLLTGIFDPAFVLVILLPLFILSLCYNIISGEREQGTLSLNAAAPVPMRVIMSAKLLVRAGVPVLTAALVLLGAALVISPAALGSAAVLAAAVILYGLFWGAAALAINGFGFDSTGNALVMSVLWISSAFIVPALIDAAVELLHPAPARSAMVLAVRNSAVKADAKLDSAQARFELEHAGTGHTHGDTIMDKGSAQEKNYRRLQSIKAAQTVGDAMYAEQQEVLARRKRMADAMRFLSPVMLMQDIVAELSGNGSVRHSSFLRQIDQFHDQWRTFFIKRAEQGMRLDGNAYDSFPQFQHQDAAVKESSARVLAGFVAMLLFLVGAAAAAKVLLNRFRLSGRQ